MSVSPETRSGGQTVDLDALLRDFYRHEMPHPWPAPRLQLAEDRPKVSPVRSLRRSHLALAASVLILIGGVGVGGGLLNTQPGDLGDGPLPGKADKRDKRDQPAAPAPPMDVQPSDKDKPFSLDFVPMMR